MFRETNQNTEFSISQQIPSQFVKTMEIHF